LGRNFKSISECFAISERGLTTRHAIKYYIENLRSFWLDHKACYEQRSL